MGWATLPAASATASAASARSLRVADAKPKGATGAAAKPKLPRARGRLEARVASVRTSTTVAVQLSTCAEERYGPRPLFCSLYDPLTPSSSAFGNLLPQVCATIDRRPKDCISYLAFVVHFFHSKPSRNCRLSLSCVLRGARLAVSCARQPALSFSRVSSALCSLTSRSGRDIKY